MKTSTLHKKAELAMKEAIYQLVKRKAKANEKLAIWKNGKVVWVSARKALKEDYKENYRA